MLCFFFDLSFRVPSTRILSYNLSSAITKTFWCSLWHRAPLQQSIILTAENNTLWERALLNTFQNLRVSSPAPVTMASPSGDTACEHHKNKKLKSWKCWWGHCILVMHANFRICVNQSQPALQIVEKLAMPLTTTVYKVNYIHQGIKDIN